MELNYLEANCAGINVYVDKLILSDNRTPLLISIFGNVDLVKAFGAGLITDNKVYIGNNKELYRDKANYRFLQQKVKDSLGHAIIYAESYFSPYHVKDRFVVYGDTKEDMNMRIWDILNFKSNVPMLNSWIDYILPYLELTDLNRDGFGYNNISMLTLPTDEYLYKVVKDNIKKLKEIEDNNEYRRK